MTKDQKLGQEIKAFRLDRGWTQAKMAGFLGISRMVIIDLEKGRANLMDLTRTKIEKQLSTLQNQAVA